MTYEFFYLHIPTVKCKLIYNNLFMSDVFDYLLRTVIVILLYCVDTSCLRTYKMCVNGCIIKILFVCGTYM